MTATNKERDLQREMETSQHLTVPMPGGHRTVCKWAPPSPQGAVYGVDNREALVRNEEIYQQVLQVTGDEAAALRATTYGRRSCRYCLAMESYAVISELADMCIALDNHFNKINERFDKTDEELRSIKNNLGDVEAQVVDALRRLDNP